MNRFRMLSAATLTVFGFVIVGFVALPTQGNAGMTETLTPMPRVDDAFAALASFDPTLLTFNSGVSATRTVLTSYQTDLTSAVLLRKPGS